MLRSCPIPVFPPAALDGGRGSWEKVGAVAWPASKDGACGVGGGPVCSPLPHSLKGEVLARLRMGSGWDGFTKRKPRYARGVWPGENLIRSGTRERV